MLEVLRFVFSDFWYFAGTLVLATVVLDGLAGIISATARLICAVLGRPTPEAKERTP